MERALEGLKVFRVPRVKWENQEEQRLDYQALQAEVVYQVFQEHRVCLVHHVCVFLTSIFILDSE